jgi:hypothetical protein
MTLTGRATFLRYAREEYEGPLPRYVENEFRSYLECGTLPFGFVHAQCTSCGLDAREATAW